MNKRGILCVFLTLLCSLRAFQLYWSSTRELRSGESWLPSSFNKHNKNWNSDNSAMAVVADKLKNDSIVLGAESNNLFYFLHVSLVPLLLRKQYIICNNSKQKVTDLHLSRYRPKGHTHHFLHFIQSILPVVK